MCTHVYEATAGHECSNTTMQELLDPLESWLTIIEQHW